MARLVHPLDANAGSHQPVTRNPRPESSQLYPLILPGTLPPESGEAPVMVAPRRRAHSEGEQAPRADNASNRSATQIRPSGSAENVRLVAKSTQAAPPSTVHTALPAPAAQTATTTTPMLPFSVSALVAEPASNSSNSSAGLVAAPDTKPLSASSRGKRAQRLATSRQKRQRRVLLAAASLFLLSRDTLRTPWLRAANVNDLGRTLVAAQSENKEHAKREFEHRKECLKTLVRLARDTATGRKILDCLQIIARESKNGDGKYLRPNEADIKGERHGDKSALQDQQLTAKAQRMVNAIHTQFCGDPLSPSLVLLLHTCDRLLVDWYRESQTRLEKPRDRPESAFLDKARRNMMVNVLILYGLSKLLAEVDTAEASKNINAVLSAAMRRLNTSARFDTLLRRSEVQMSNDLQVFVQYCQRERRRYNEMAEVLKNQGVTQDHHEDIWRWLSRVQSVLNLPEFAKMYFERAALNSDELAKFAVDRKSLDSIVVGQWMIAATNLIIQEQMRGQMRLTVPGCSALLRAKDLAISLTDKQLRQDMAGFE